ncbi:MAG TPA: sulfur carrier protein ThiS [Pyrinomonadaceae bacterium]|nr:sulfur carrier protein ThiS [Pyrinomonadaceae bacterium]
MKGRNLRVQVNGEIRELPEKTTLDELVRELSLAPERLAIELNREVVRRAAWPLTEMREGDTVEIVHFVGGGSGRERAGEERGKSRR